MLCMQLGGGISVSYHNVYDNTVIYIDTVVVDVV